MVRGRPVGCSCVAAALGLLHACGTSVFACADPSECPGGLCEPSGYCSFPDAACPSGQRYGAHAPASLADGCVEPVGGGSSEGSTDDSTSDATGSLTIATLESTMGEASSQATAEASATSAETTDSDTSPPPDLPPTDACVVESFDDGSIDGFVVWNDAELGMIVEDGTLVMTLVPGPAYAGVDSPSAGFVERDLQVTVLAVPNQAVGTQVLLGVDAGTSTMLMIQEYGVLRVRYDDGEALEDLVQFDAYATTLWRVWSHGDALGFDRAMPGGEWEPLWSGPAPFDLTSAHGFFGVGTWELARAPGSAQLDDLSDCPYL